jgi:hypothetical protein
MPDAVTARRDVTLEPKNQSRRRVAEPVALTLLS